MLALVTQQRIPLLPAAPVLPLDDLQDDAQCQHEIGIQGDGRHQLITTHGELDPDNPIDDRRHYACRVDRPTDARS